MSLFAPQLSRSGFRGSNEEEDDGGFSQTKEHCSFRLQQRGLLQEGTVSDGVISCLHHYWSSV